MPVLPRVEVTAGESGDRGSHHTLRQDGGQQGWGSVRKDQVTFDNLGLKRDHGDLKLRIEN